MHDFVIRDANIIDGSGAPAYRGDIAIDQGKISQVGGSAGKGRREFNAAGCLATPGFVDVHTHYDGQVWWDSYLSPSSWHGVTSIVMGNCGVGFAPVRPADRNWVMDLMESIEDIPGQTLREGLPWGWSTFPEFLDALERRPLAIDVGAQLPHAALRVFAMGERGVNNEPATGADLQAMCAIVREAMQAGALGLTGTRSVNHRTLAGKNAPGFGLAVSELIALGRAVAESGRFGTLGFNVDFSDVDEEVGWLTELRRATGLPVWVLLNQQAHEPDKWLSVLDGLQRSTQAGAPVFAQVAGRPISILMGLTSSRNPFLLRPSYQQIAALPLAERVARLRDPAFRKRLLAETAEYPTEVLRTLGTRFDLMFPLGDPPDYEPTADKSIAARAAKLGLDPAELALDTMLQRDGQELFFVPVTNYADGDASVVMRMLKHPNVFLGLADGGAHVSRICDSSVPTYMLSYWARDRTRGPKFSLEEVVRMQTSSTARFFGLHDRGLLAAGMKADLNLIDFERLRLHAPEMAHDQPAGAQRLVQHAEGYVMTMVAGQPIFEQGKPTGALPGTLMRRRA